MLKILILEDSPELTDRLAFVLESIPGIMTARVTNRNEAENALKASEQKTDLFVVDYHELPLNALSDVQKLAKGIPCIFCVQNSKNELPPPGWNVFATLERKNLPEALLQTVEKWRTEHASQIVVPAEDDKFCRIKTSLLIDVSPLHSDIYVKLSDSKYLKLFRQGDIFDGDDLKKYFEDKKIEYMYLPKKTSHAFVQKYISFIKELIQNLKPVSINELAYLHDSVQETVKELTEKMGFTSEVQELARAQIELTVKTMGKSPTLKNMLRRLEGQKGKYLSDHSFLTGYIACAMADQMAWSSEATYVKLTLAAFMHDIVLSEELARCETLAEAQSLNLGDEALNEYTKHPYKVSEMIRSMSEIPPDVDVIVMQHHELPGGGGFPRGVNSTHISPLSAIFMVAHDMAKIFLKERELFSIASYVQIAQLKFTQGAFRKILAAISEIVL